MRRVGIAAVVAVIALGLVGCGGIPGSGAVQQGEIIDEQDAPDFGYDPSGPQAGATQEDILLGFIQAATSPQEDYNIARQFLTSSFAEDWEPNTITQVRSGVGVTQPNDDGSFTYSFSSSAFVDNLGTYKSEQATQRLDFTFAQNADGEWRINGAPDGIVLSAEGFDTIFEQSALYYFDSTYRYLVPDVRWFPGTTRLATRQVLALLSGQSGWLAQGVTYSEFPSGTKLNSAVTIESGVATVDLSAEVLDATAESRARLSEQLKYTLGVSSVVITVSDVEIEVPDSKPVPIVNPSAQGTLLGSTDEGFGFLGGGGGVSQLDGQSAEIEALDAVDVTLSNDREFSAVRAPDGVHIVFSDGSDQMLLDARAGLVAPSTDTSGFVWSVPSANGAAIRAFDTAGARFDIASPIVPGTQVSSFAVSRDGSRLLVYSSTASGTRLNVYGILRTDGVPYALGPPFEVAVDQTLSAIDAAWVDDRTIATIAGQSSSDSAVVTLHVLGGQSQVFGRVVGGKSIVGSSDVDGLRVVAADGELFRPRGNGWGATGLIVSFLATQQ